MKSLADRKKQRAESRANALADSPNQDTGIVQDGDDAGSDNGEFDGLTIDQLKSVASERYQTEVPKDKTKRDDILEFVKNLAAFKAAEGADAGGENTGTQWKSGN